MHTELKRAILNWLLDNSDRWQRVNVCREEFRAYIFDANGNYLFGGEDVCEFIKNADRLIYGGKAL